MTFLIGFFTCNNLSAPETRRPTGELNKRENGLPEEFLRQSPLHCSARRRRPGTRNESPNFKILGIFLLIFSL